MQQYELSEMPRELYRTNRTALSDDVLLVLDVMLEASVTYPMLRQRNFASQFNASPHSLTDADLQSTLRRLVSDKILEWCDDRLRDHPYISMTPHGGALWASERCPVWKRFCMERYPAEIRGRSIMSVVAVSADICDDFLQLWPEYPARRKRKTIRDIGLVPWHPFGTLHVGLASYHDPAGWSCDEFVTWHQKHKEHIERVEAERTWWRSVGELQKFVRG